MLEGQLKRKEASASTPAGSPPASAPPTAASPPASASPAAGPASADPAAPGSTAPPTPAAAAATTPEVPGRKPILGLTDSPVTGLSMGAYGEIHYGVMQNPAAGGQ